MCSVIEMTSSNFNFNFFSCHVSLLFHLIGIRLLVKIKVHQAAVLATNFNHFTPEVSPLELAMSIYKCTLWNHHSGENLSVVTWKGMYLDRVG